MGNPPEMEIHGESMRGIFLVDAFWCSKSNFGGNCTRLNMKGAGANTFGSI